MDYGSRKMPGSYVLDAFAFMAFFNREPAEPQVRAILEDPASTIHVGIVNVGEVYYALIRRRGVAAADEAVDSIFAFPTIKVMPATWQRVRAAAQIKSRGGLSYADSFVAALAHELAIPVVTGDPEFTPLERQGLIQVVWLRRR